MLQEWVFLRGLESEGEDSGRLEPETIPTDSETVAYNTLGCKKRAVKQLTKCPAFGNDDGIYLRKDVYTKCLQEFLIPLTIRQLFETDNDSTLSATRKAFLLTTDLLSERTIFSANILKTVGFQVHAVIAFPHEDKFYSNRITMHTIYQLIACGEDEFVYVFENDINILEPVSLRDILQYETHVDKIMYLGLCKRDGDIGMANLPITIAGKTVKTISGFVRGLHAIGLSKAGAQALFHFASSCSEPIMDMVVEEFSTLHPAIIMRYDLESYIHGHRGIFYQDRIRFPSEI